METKQTKQFLRCNLSRDELLEYGKVQAEKIQELARVEADLKRVQADFKAKIVALDAEIVDLSNKVASGYEFRDVTCTVFLGLPTPNQKRTVRDDTGEDVSVEYMTPDEMQRLIPGIEPK